MTTVVSRPVFARFYTKVAGPGLEKAGITGHRERLLAGTAGEVIEIGAGNGLNFPHYPPQVHRLLAIEPEPRLRALAGQAARAARVPTEIQDGRAEQLPVPDESFDAAVACMTLCSVADPAAALAELHRVLRPGGQLRFLEHVRAGTPGMRRVQRAADATVWPLLMGGCRTGRDTLGSIAAAGFALARVDHFSFPETKLPFPAAHHVLGTALRDAPPV